MKYKNKQYERFFFVNVFFNENHKNHVCPQLILSQKVTRMKYEEQKRCGNKQICKSSKSNP